MSIHGPDTVLDPSLLLDLLDASAPLAATAGPGAGPSFEALEDRTVPAKFAPLPGTLDGTAGSLRAVINQANSNVDTSNMFNLSAGTYNLEALGDLQLTAAKTYIFVGKGPGLTFIDAHQFERVFDITKTVTVVFQNLTIQNGLATDNGSVGTPFDTDALGGGILNNGGAVTLDNAVVKNCRATGSAGANGTASSRSGGGGMTAAGGGIFSMGGSLTLLNGAALTGDQANAGNGGNGFSGGQFSGGGSGGDGGDAFGGGLAASGTVVSITGAPSAPTSPGRATAATAPVATLAPVKAVAAGAAMAAMAATLRAEVCLSAAVPCPSTETTTWATRRLPATPATPATASAATSAAATAATAATLRVVACTSVALARRA